ncbi:protein of unknown function [Paenibacillus alvei]|uniref:GrpB family protein n=1 Tax=Paenibacillus alvei TaxID=44250 RepID=A0A383RAI1_PAEAL|nr:protein of unknown function [Paenibacillus alvei]
MRHLRVSIGSTSVEGLAAKPIIDIQVSVRSWDDSEHLIRQFNSIGYVHRADNPDKTKRYFREAPGGKRTHIHVRELGSWRSSSRSCSEITCAAILMNVSCMLRSNMS